jgi:cell division transport system ATP-binding protein
LIQLYHVNKRYENGTDALVDATLRVREGEFVFLTGASGAGKSTLLRLLLVMERVSDGQVLIGGRNVHVLRDASVPYLRRNIGLVFQDFKLIPRRTVFENVAIAMEILGLAKPEIERRVMQLLGDLGLEHRARAMPSALSGGEQQRVALARALANEPAILLADEPTGNLDPALGVEIMDLLLDINRRGTTVIVATHDYALVKRYGLRVVHLEQGRIAADRPRTHPADDTGDIEDIMPPAPKREKNPKVLLPTATIAPIREQTGEPTGDQTGGQTGNLTANQASDQDGNDPEPQASLTNNDEASPQSTTAHRKSLSGGFTAANVRVEVARITGPIVPLSGPGSVLDDDDAARRPAE